MTMQGHVNVKFVTLLMLSSYLITYYLFLMCFNFCVLLSRPYAVSGLMPVVPTH